GKKAHPTLRAGAIRACQLDRFPSRRLEEAGLLSARGERLATHRTLRTLLLRHPAPVLGLPYLHHVLDQLCPQLVDPFIHGCFNLGPRRVWRCSLRHWVIPSTSRRPALTCRICSLRCRLFFAFILSSLS